MADTPKVPPMSPKTAALLAVALALIVAAMAYFPGTAPYLTPICQAFGGCAQDVAPAQ